jgi:hypothetical protein
MKVKIVEVAETEDNLVSDIGKCAKEPFKPYII